MANRRAWLSELIRVSLADAREKRDEAWSTLCEGQDPNVAKRLKIEANTEASRQTFERIAREWYGNAKAQWATIHASDVIRSLERDVFPTIGSLPIAQLSPPLILGVLREIETRGAIETAKRVRQRISAVFVYAIAQGIATSDPAEKLGAVLKPLRKGRQPAITDIVPLRKMILAAEEDNARPITRLGLRMLALTAVRPSELRGAEWAEFEDLDGKLPLWRIPSTRMKGDLDRKQEINGDHLVPLTPQALERQRQMVDLRLHDAGDLAMALGAAPHLRFGPQRVFAQLVDGGVIVVLDLIGQRQVGRVEDAGFAAKELQQPCCFLDREP